jgi:hypothetical protein
MTTVMYALVKDGKVENILSFEDATEELIETFKVLNGCDHAIEVPAKFGLEGESALTIDCTWDGEDFILPKPFPSYILDENKEWIAPVPQPDDNKMYDWDEDSLSWVLLEFPNVGEQAS